MGILGLLKHLGAVAETGVHVSRYRDQTVAIDGYGWLHRACYGCAWELNVGKPHEAEARYTKYMVQRVKLLRHSAVEALVVFDGGRLGMKAMTNTKRQADRKNQRAEGMRYVQ